MQINIDVSGWTQEQKNLLKAMCVKLLYDNGIIYDKVVCTQDGLIDVINNSSDPTPVLTKANIESAYTAWRAQADIEQAQALADQTERDNEIASNQFTGITLTDVDNYIDGMSTVEDLKTGLKKLARYIIAKRL